MDVAIVDSDVAYPPTSGKRLRTLNLMLQMAKRHQIHYLARGQEDSSQYDQAREYLSRFGIRTYIVHDPIPRKQGLFFYVRLLGNLLSPLPYSVASHHSETFRRAVLDYAAQHRIDLWQVEWMVYLYVLPSPRVGTVVQAHNVDSLIWQRYYEAERNPLKRWYIYQQWRKFFAFERRAFQIPDQIVAVSAADAALAREWYGVSHIEVVDNGVDVAYFQDVRPASDSKAILFLGSLDWRPNLDALTVLLDDIFPMVRQRIPDARLLLVGRLPPASLRRRVQGIDGVELHADVLDVRPFLAASAVMAVPLRIGGGSRLKILEALAAGLPVVSTRVGAEGLALRPGVDLTIADTPFDQAMALIDCLERPEAAREMAEQGRQSVVSQYDWASLANRLERVWEKARLASSPS